MIRDNVVQIGLTVYYDQVGVAEAIEFSSKIGEFESEELNGNAFLARSFPGRFVLLECGFGSEG
ncbi:hypothetical protein [Symmachiella macrocystis]|uniref:hypothetical protein n=1 Tax=Symmachiella macrocystis TaxID=2527985 RepID=UPI0011B5AF40|nr:hypothetical protein [Symmachiella macrocystis]